MENQNYQLLLILFLQTAENHIVVQKNIGAQITHLHIPSLCKEFFMMRHNLGHSNKGAFVQRPQFSDFFSMWFLPQDNFGW